jgi:hypothetical protein
MRVVQHNAYVNATTPVQLAELKTDNSEIRVDSLAQMLHVTKKQRTELKPIEQVVPAFDPVSNIASSIPPYMGPSTEESTFDDTDSVATGMTDVSSVADFSSVADGNESKSPAKKGEKRKADVLSARPVRTRSGGLKDVAKPTPRVTRSSRVKRSGRK